MSKPLAMKELFFIFFKKITDLYKPISKYNKQIYNKYGISYQYSAKLFKLWELKA